MELEINLDKFTKHLSFWHNKTDDECIKLAEDKDGNLDAEQALLNMLERDFCTDMNNEVIKQLSKESV